VQSVGFLFNFSGDWHPLFCVAVDIEELFREHPEEFKRDYDENSGLLFKSWVIDNTVLKREE